MSSKLQINTEFVMTFPLKFELLTIKYRKLKILIHSFISMIFDLRFTGVFLCTSSLFHLLLWLVLSLLPGANFICKQPYVSSNYCAHHQNITIVLKKKHQNKTKKNTSENGNNSKVYDQYV